MTPEATSSFFTARLPDFSNGNAASSHSAVDDFRLRYLKADPNRVKDSRLNILFDDLGTGRFWGVLAFINEDSEARVWAQKNFTAQELQNILDICVSVALVPLPEVSSPGKHRGHSILWSDLIDKPDSMFRSAFDGDFRKRLNNGRFWEELPDMRGYLNYGHSYGVVQDVLMRHFDDLDLGFVPEGFKIFQRNSHGGNDFDFKGLGREAVYRYGRFIAKINKDGRKLGLSGEDIARLVKPYVVSLVEMVHESIVASDDSLKMLLQTELRSPICQKYLGESDLVQKSVADELLLKAKWSSDGGEPEAISAVLSYIPDPKGMFDRIFSDTKWSAKGLREFMQRCKEAGLLTEYT